MKSWPFAFSLSSKLLGYISVPAITIPPLTISYVISSQELSNCIEHAKQSSSSLIPSGYTCSFCLLRDLNMPDTDWNSIYSTSSFENQYLDINVSHGLSASINIPTHKAGKTLDNILLENVNQFDNFLVIKDLFLSVHYPILFNCLISSSSSKSTPLASSYSFNSAKEILSFIDSWSYFTFTDFSSSTTVDTFYSHSNFMISQTFTRKKNKKTLEYPVLLLLSFNALFKHKRNCPKEMYSESLG